jgi:predicted nucleic acid-binding Zn ribbon protein
MSDEPVAVCPVCGAPARRLFFPAGIVFKGSGFYKTDSRRVSGDGSGTSSPSGTSSAKSPKTASPEGGSSPSTPTAAGAAGD